MIEADALGEAAALARRSLDPDLPAMKAVGVPEILRHLRGEIPLEAAITAGQQATRRYAKRQMTWFRRETGVRWLKGFGDEAEIQADALAIARSAVISRVPGAGGMDV